MQILKKNNNYLFFLAVIEICNVTLKDWRGEFRVEINNDGKLNIYGDSHDMNISNYIKKAILSYFDKY